MSQSKSRPNWIGEVISSRYQIESKLGQGGMSSVYKATDPNLQRTVAIKLIHPHLSSDQEFIRRFEQEAAAVAQLRHPNIIQVFDFNHDQDLYYMVLEYVPGDTLQSKLKTIDEAGHQLPFEETIRIMVKVSEAVGYAHEKNMIHRDLKPANVMLNPKGEPILMDFGVAKMLGGTHHTATGAIIGTAKYMSPEQASGDRPDHRTDIYSLGVMLYEMLTGDPPFDADSTVAILMKHVTQPVPDIRQLKQDAPDDLVQVIEKALAKKPDDRYQSANDLARALRELLPNRAGAGAGTGQEATILQAPPTAVSSTPPTTAASSAPTTAQPQKQGLPGWAIGAGAAVLLLLLAAGAFFFLSGSDDQSPAEAAQSGEEAQAVAAADTEPGLPSPEKMIRIPGGTYTVGVEEGSGDPYAPLQEVTLEDFWIDQYEVTNEQYANFVDDAGFPAPQDWSNGQFPAEEAQHPVDNVDWEAATAYCAWAGKRLPTEAEWEVAARGSTGRLFPWGNNQSVVPLPQSGTYAVGSKPTNQSSFGVFDMAGNVWEWVDSPYTPVEQGNRVLRGGANGFAQNMAYRLQGNPSLPTMQATAGIRCAASQVDQSQIAKVLEEGVMAQDDFTDPGSGWPILTEGTFLYGYHPPAYYHVQVNTTDDHTVVTRDPALSDFTVESNVQVFSAQTSEGNFRYGLAFRRASEEEYYALAVSPRAGTWRVLKSSSAGLETLVEGEIDTLRGIAPPGFTPDPEDVDQLRVDAQGSDFLFFINGEPVAHITDSDYASGEIGFFVQNFEETLSHIHYDLFTIREVEYDEAVAAALPEPSSTTASAEEAETESETEESGSTSASDSLAGAESTEEPEPGSEEEPDEEPTQEATEEPTAEPTEEAPDVPEGMVLIPAGYFMMGSNEGEALEAPEHPVFVDAFYLDRTEVTNAEYRACVEDGACSPGNAADSWTRTGYRDDPAYDDYPVIAINWNQANAYCQWADKRLPTEAEWEYAASGPEDLTWPWGDTFDPALSAASAEDVQPVGSYPEGASPFGVLDMAGNVGEWVADTFSEEFYAESPPVNPLDRSSGNGRVYRGGTFANPDGAFYTTSRRYGNVRTFSEVDIGFRCAADAPVSVTPNRAELVEEFCQEVYAEYKPGGKCP